MRPKRPASAIQFISSFALVLLHIYVCFVDATFLQRTASPVSGYHTVRLRRRLLVSPLHLKRGGTKKKQDKGSTITVNKLAFRNYEVLEKWEAGIALQGTEVKRYVHRNHNVNEKYLFLNLNKLILGTYVAISILKSIRDGKMNIRDGFIKPNKNGRSCTLLNVHIGKHATAGSFFQHEERRPRELLLHRSEARKLLQKTDKMPGMTIVPLKAYWSEQNKVKFEIGLCRGKNQSDKRQDIKEREDKRDINRMLKNFNDGR